MPYVVDTLLKTTPWIPGILNPERPGFYQRDRRTRVPSVNIYMASEEGERFLAEYPPSANLPPAIGTTLDLEYRDGKQWMFDHLRRIPSYVGPGKERCYWRGGSSRNRYWNCGCRFVARRMR